MPLKVKSFCTSVLLVLTSFFVANAQTSADVMRERVAKAKAFIAVRNYNAAIYELENIRRETSEPTVNGVINVLLINSYLEQGDYTRAQEFLKELSNAKKINIPGGSASYFAAAGQIVKGARNQLERYRALGLSVSDRTLPIEASVDVQKMRETLELVIEQSKTLSKEKDKTSDSMALIDEATNVRSTLAKDDYDANRWKSEAADARETLASSRSVVVNAVNMPPTETNKPETTTAALIPPPANPNTTVQTKPASTNPAFQPVQNPSAGQSAAKTPPADNSKPAAGTVVQKENPNNAAANNGAPEQEVKNSDETAKSSIEETKNPPAVRERSVESRETEKTPNQTAAETIAKTDDAPKDNSPVAVGSLVEYATERTNPVYPATARSMRMTGVVKVELMINEQGQVAAVQNASGPSLLRSAASDAVKKWRFKPFLRDGEPVKATGFVSFNFSL